MASRSFSITAEEAAFEYADEATHQLFGMSYGEYCGSVLIKAIQQGVELPKASHIDEADQRKNAVAKMQAFSKHAHNEAIGHMSDEEIKNLISVRYK